MIVILGSSGLVGSARFGFDEGRKVLTPDEGELDITDRTKISQFIKQTKPQSIILLAAYTEVDGAEENRALAWRVNVGGVENVATAAKEVGAFLVYISTDFVFPGTRDLAGPYNEDTVLAEEVKQRGWYGTTKHEGEKIVLGLEPRSAVVRIAFPFGNLAIERDYLRKILRGINKGYAFFADQALTPTYTKDLWTALDKIEKEERGGIWHVATKPATTPYKLAVYLNEVLGLGKNIGKMSIFDYLKNYKAPRPIFGGLKTEKTEKELGLSFHTWRQAVDELAPELKKLSLISRGEPS